MKTTEFFKAVQQIQEYWSYKLNSSDEEVVDNHLDISQKIDGGTTDSITAQYADTIANFDQLNEEEIAILEKVMEKQYEQWDAGLFVETADPLALVLGKKGGKKSAEVRKKKGHDSEYYKGLARKRWSKSKDVVK